jgi:hypothetical protein
MSDGAVIVGLIIGWLVFTTIVIIGFGFVEELERRDE